MHPHPGAPHPALAAASPVRTAATMTRPEQLASARRRIDDLSKIYGTDSRQVREALQRWERICNRRPTQDDVMALVDATLGGVR